MSKTISGQDVDSEKKSCNVEAAAKQPHTRNPLHPPFQPKQTLDTKVIVIHDQSAASFSSSHNFLQAQPAEDSAEEPETVSFQVSIHLHVRVKELKPPDQSIHFYFAAYEKGAK